MPHFFYRARDNEGVLRTGRVEAPDTATLESDLERMGLIPIRIVALKRPFTNRTIKLKELFQRITSQDMILFSRQLATLIGAGVSLTKSLSTLEAQMENPRFVKVISTVREDVEGGSTFTEALSKHPAVFPEIYYNMIEAGESGGIMEEVLDRMAAMFEKNAENRAKVKSATLYPKIVVGAIIIAVIILMSFVIPRFASLYSSFDVPLPLPTRILIAMSNAFTSYWYVPAIALVFLILLIRLYISTERGKYNRDRLSLSIPVFGPLLLKSILSRFGRVLGALYKSGLPILRSLDIVSRAVENRVVASAVKSIEEDVRAGKGLSTPMADLKLFPPMVVQMVATGEETGKLDEMLDKVAQYYDNEVDSAIRNLTTLLEPFLLAFIFGIVLFLALAIFLPMWDLVRLVRR
jgi:type II secretory pathway component PulF